jgi:hypothetical protein
MNEDRINPTSGLTDAEEAFLMYQIDQLPYGDPDRHQMVLKLKGRI